jgi:pimeloyl-ACP methyl ester carboxylesterase
VTFSLIAIHGNGGGGFRFERMKPFIPTDVRFTAVTLPGFGDMPRNPAITSLRGFADALHTLIQPLPAPRIFLGHGIGGSIALEFLQHYSSDISGLILHAPVGTRLDTRLFPKLMKPVFVRDFGKWLFSSRLARPAFTRLLFSQPVPKEFLNRFFDEYRKCQVFSQLFDLITPTWFSSLAPVQTPSILLWGEAERVLSSDQAADYQTVLPNSRLHLVPKWDHFPMVETPEDYTSVVMTLARELLSQKA